MTCDELFMPFPNPQLLTTFLSRPQRFLAEMTFPGGGEVIVYCANPGSLNGCLKTGSTALIWDSADSKRKRRYTWRAIELEGVWVGTDTHLANRLVEQALRRKLIPGLDTYDTLARECLVEAGFRVDFLLSGVQGTCIIEVKSATVVEKGVARYPDSSTPRGVKQLKVLTRKATEGLRSVLIFLVQRDDAKCFVVSNSHDPAYAEAFEKAVAAGVEVMALAFSVCPEGFGAPKMLPYAQKPMSSMKTT
ncbi:MAG: DNA/RNA nuclease SfsA [Desulfobulbus sp.]|nr:DNA/RNA nuclease SfsA [Desulfobulbus sp.]